MDKMLEVLYYDFRIVKGRLQQASFDMFRHNECNNSVFVASVNKLANVFPMLIDKGDMQNELFYYETNVDNLCKLSVIDANKFSAFMQRYKDPRLYCCILCIVGSVNNSYVYLPY